MAAGKYLATTSQDEVLEAELRLERIHIRDHRDLELNRLREDAQSWLPNSRRSLGGCTDRVLDQRPESPLLENVHRGGRRAAGGRSPGSEALRADLPVSVSRCPAPRIV